MSQFTNTTAPYHRIENEQKGVFLLAKTSNDSSGYLQNINNKGVFVYERVVKMAKELNKNNKGQHENDHLMAQVNLLNKMSEKQSSILL